MPRRTLGRTGREVSIVALGGIVVSGEEPDHAAKVVAESVARGVNYFDVAPSYDDAELKLGPALKPYRESAFLACKTLERDRKGAERELAESLKRLETDHLDLYQLHALDDVKKDVETALGKGGAIEAFVEARRQGRIRFIGFSAHSPEAALAALREFDFDTVMCPVNFVCHYRSHLDQAVLAEARKRNVGVIALKVLAKQRWPEGADRTAYPKCWYQPVTDPDLAKLALSWSLAQGVTVAIPPGEESLFRMALDLAPQCTPPTDRQAAMLKEMAADLQPIFQSQA